jgi:CubicO group peptidase (beta-lactamase class C family)
MKPYLPCALLFSFVATDLPAQLPVSGRPVTHAADGTEITSFSLIDTKIQTLMQNKGIDAGVVGINRGGTTIYLRGFGWLEKPGPAYPGGIPLPETAMFRVASVTKVVTAAAIHAMAEDNLLGPAGLNRKVFNLAGNGGMLNVTPFGGLGDPDFANITISHLLGHAGGFRREDDPYNNLRGVATDLNVLSPPTMNEIMQWRLGRPLKGVPGMQSIQNWTGAWQSIASSSVGNPTIITTTTPHGYETGQKVTVDGHTGSVPPINGKHTITVINSTSFSIPVDVTTGGAGGTLFNEGFDPYSNFGFNVLGQIVEMAPGGYDEYVRNRVLGPGNWIPSGDWARGRTLLIERHHREPRYQSTVPGEQWPNIFDNLPPYEGVEPPYGGFSLSAGFWAGGMIASAQALIQFGRFYQTGYTPPASGAIHNIGSRITQDNPPLNGDHAGGFAGTSSILIRYANDPSMTVDDLVIFIAFTKSAPEPEEGYERQALAEINPVLNNIAFNRWPNRACDGFWVKPTGSPVAGRGGYHSEFETFIGAYGAVTDGSTLRFKPGVYTLSAPTTITRPLKLDAPEGPVLFTN